MNALLVEDDSWVAECYQGWLNKAGHSVVWARDAQAALDAFDESQVDLVILDIMLPLHSGIQVLHNMASNADMMNVPVIVCSSVVPPEDLWWLEYGVVDVLDKTALKRRQLLAAVERAHHAAGKN